MIKQMDLESISTRMAPSMKASGKMTCSMAWGLKLGLIAPNMKDSII